MGHTDKTDGRTRCEDRIKMWSNMTWLLMIGIIMIIIVIVIISDVVAVCTDCSV